MTDALHSSVAFAPYRDSVDEEAPLNPGDAEAGAAGGPAGPGSPATQDWRTSRRLDIGSAIIASRVLVVASATFLLLNGLTITVILGPRADNPDVSWRIQEMLKLLSLNAFLSLFLSAASLAIFSRARVRGEMNPSPLAMLLNAVAHAGIGVILVVATINIFDEASYWDAPESYDKTVVLFFVWVTGAVILGWIIVPALLIFWLRGLIIWVSTRESWTSLSLPGGELVFQISIRFHRQEPLRDAEGPA